MNSRTIVPIAIGLGVILVFALAAVAMARTTERAEERLADITGQRRKRKRGDRNALSSGILARPAAIDLDRSMFWARMVPNAESLNLLYEQADVSLTLNAFAAISGGLALVGALLVLVFRLPVYAAPVAALLLGALPFLWLLRRRAKRIQEFIASMPGAVELISRALRAGHGLASGMRLVAEEMKGPVADEFNRVFEEQNLGVPIELALRGLADRIPSMDVRFFVIAVVVQRSSGGDLAEVLDKIGKLVRQRFELHGHVKSLTAEGRLSGVVLLAMPPSLLAFLAFANYDYVSVLFTTSVGVKMLSFTVVLQLLGAWAIKKIVAIKV